MGRENDAERKWKKAVAEEFRQKHLGSSPSASSFIDQKPNPLAFVPRQGKRGRTKDTHKRPPQVSRLISSSSQLGAELVAKYTKPIPWSDREKLKRAQTVIPDTNVFVGSCKEQDKHCIGLMSLALSGAIAICLTQETTDEALGMLHKYKKESHQGFWEKAIYLVRAAQHIEKYVPIPRMAYLQDIDPEDDKFANALLALASLSPAAKLVTYDDDIHTLSNLSDFSGRILKPHEYLAQVKVD